MCPAEAYAVLHRSLLPEREAGGKDIVEDEADDISRRICRIYIKTELQQEIHAIVYRRGNCTDDAKPQCFLNRIFLHCAINTVNRKYAATP